MALEKISLHCILNKKKYLAIFQFFEKMFFNFKEASTKHLCHTQSILVVKGVYVCVTQGGGVGVGWCEERSFLKNLFPNMVNGILKFVKTISANVKLNINQQEIKELVAVSLP